MEFQTECVDLTTMAMVMEFIENSTVLHVMLLCLLWPNAVLLLASPAQAGKPRRSWEAKKCIAFWLVQAHCKRVQIMIYTLETRPPFLGIKSVTWSNNISTAREAISLISTIPNLHYPRGGALHTDKALGSSLGKCSFNDISVLRLRLSASEKALCQTYPSS